MDFDYNKKNDELENGTPQEQPLGGHDAPKYEPTARQDTAPVDAPQAGWNAEPPSSGQHDAPQAGWNAEPRTPHQTPVRPSTAEQYQSYEDWRRAQSDKPPVSSQQELQNSTYEQWQRQQYAAQQEQPKKRRKSPVILAVGGIAAACLLVAAGVGIGSQWNAADTGNDSPSASVQPVDPSKPSVSITDTPAGSISSTSSDDGLSGEAVYNKVSPSVVSVISSSLLSEGQSSGSGVIMSADGYVITNHHVVDGAQKVTVVTSDGIQHNAIVEGSDETTDLAVLKITDANGVAFQQAEFGDSSKIQAGERAYAIGSPGGIELANTITTGSISAISRDITIDDRVMTLIQTDASINPGNSGGALINKYGQVIGITSAKLGISYYEGLGFAIPIDAAKEIVDQLIQHGYVPGRPAIGISGGNLSKERAEYNNVPQGLLITSVDARSDAATQGLQVNDIIIGVNGEAITTMDEVNEAKNGLKAGDKMTLTVYRISTGKTMDITITLADEYDLSQQEVPTTQQGQQPSNNGNEYFTFPW